MSIRRRGFVIAVGGLTTMASCIGATEVHPVARVTLSPSHVAVVKGGSQQLAVAAFDSSGAATGASVSWTSSAPTVATVSESGVVSAVGYGVSTIQATVSGKGASAEVVVTAPPITGAYSVLDLTPVPASPGVMTTLNDSGLVLAGLLYRDGVGSGVPGCNAVALNNRSHLLCSAGPLTNFNRYSLWREGVMTPIAASDSFAAAGFAAFALNDSDVVAGLYYQPAFSNPGCIAASGRCVVLWKDGQPTFPGVYETGSRYIMFLNNRLDLVVQLGISTGEPGEPPPYLHSIASGQRRTLAGIVGAVNDEGWTAVERYFIHHGAPTTFEHTALLDRVDVTITFGSGAATGINAAGVVVGTLVVGPFLRASDGVALLTHAATDPGWTFTRALRINNRGQILAQGNHVDGRTSHWVVLTPVTP
jgi:hypothetical protein